MSRGSFRPSFLAGLFVLFHGFILELPFKSYYYLIKEESPWKPEIE
jgi:hypothetical protein